MADELRRLAAQRRRIAIALTTVMVVAYFGFVLLVAYGKSIAGTTLLGGRLSVGIVLGASLIVLAAALTGIYVRWANRVYDPALARLRRDR